MLNHVRLFATPWTVAHQAMCPKTEKILFFRWYQGEWTVFTWKKIFCEINWNGKWEFKAISMSFGFSGSHMWMWELDHKESWAPKNWTLFVLTCGAGEDSWESLERPLRDSWVTTRNSSQSILKKIIHWNIHWKGWCWSYSTLATWCKELTHWKIPWCWERSRAGVERGGMGWNG